MEAGSHPFMRGVNIDNEREIKVGKGQCGWRRQGRLESLKSGVISWAPVGEGGGARCGGFARLPGPIRKLLEPGALRETGQRSSYPGVAGNELPVIAKNPEAMP